MYWRQRLIGNYGRRNYMDYVHRAAGYYVNSVIPGMRAGNTMYRFYKHYYPDQSKYGGHFRYTTEKGTVGKKFKKKYFHR